MVPWLFNGGIRWIQYCSFNKENSDDKPSKLEVPYYQTNPHCLLGSLFEHPLSLSFSIQLGVSPYRFVSGQVMTLCSQLLWGAPPGEQVGAMLLGQASGNLTWQTITIGFSFDLFWKQRILMILYGFCMDFLWVSRYPVVLHSSVRQVRMMSQNPRRALAACNVFAASQCLYQTGIELPVASSMACFFSMDINAQRLMTKVHTFQKLVAFCCT